ncbi:MAG: MlaD family protein [Endomicrobiaceae bacterium]
MSNELKLGFFVALGILAVLTTVTLLGNLSLKSKYKINVYFADASGLPKKAKVKISGVDVGSIKDIVLEDDKAKIILLIDNKIKIYSDAKIKIVSMGIIGTKYIDIKPGTPSNRLLSDGDTITALETESLEEMLSSLAKQVGSVFNNVSEGMNGDFFHNLSDTVANLKKVSQTIADKEKAISDVIDNFQNFSADLSEITKQNKEDIRTVVLELKKISLKVDEIVTKINNGEGTLGTLINDEEMAKELKQTVTEIKTTVKQIQTMTGKASKLEIDWEYMGRFDARADRFRNDFGIRFRPNNHKFYYLGISNMGNSNNEKDQFERDNLNKLDALIGFRSEKLEAYGGIMRSKGGVGIGYSPLDKIYSGYRKLYFNVDAIFRTETPANDDKNADTPNIIIGARLGIFHWCYAGVQVEDTLTKTSFMPYIKIKITDQDLASMFGVASIAATGSK